jgi:putative phosphoribosyl transferase
MKESEIHVDVKNSISLTGNLTIPPNAGGVVVFSHGSGSSRFSVRNRQVAGILNTNGFATLLIDLLTNEEDTDTENRFNIELLTMRLVSVISYSIVRSDLRDLPVGLFGASTGAASALKAAAFLPQTVKAVVSRGGRPDLAGADLARVAAPTLLIVGSLDTEVIHLNDQAFLLLTCEKEMKIVRNAGHLFEEPGKLDEVGFLAVEWFRKHFVMQKVQVPE